jgi:uncharacterized Zn-binding protein involved in type VI secretion
MADYIRFGDKTTGSSTVISASTTMRFDGRFIARKGDEVSTCPKHPDIKPNLIIEGDEKATDNGIPIARHGHQVSCGCKLISSLV